ncbi:MAG: GTP-binding protein [Candidatus Lokiarchaeota archaeon]|nr:GTP-binding protein [Candidatus Lokiarchaeota archaeon]
MSSADAVRMPNMIVKQPTIAIARDYDHNLRVNLYGDERVGISCLLNRLIEGSYDEKYHSPGSLSLRVHQIDVNGKTVKLRLFDMRPVPRFKAIPSTYASFPNILIYVFDSTDERSFENIKGHLEDSSKEANQASIKLLVATKIDYTIRRIIDTATATSFAEKNKMTYVETSAKENINVTELFVNCTKFYLSILDKRVASQDTSSDPQCNIL